MAGDPKRNSIRSSVKKLSLLLPSLPLVPRCLGRKNGKNDSKMSCSVYQTNEEKECGRRERKENFSDYIVPGLKTIEVSQLRRERRTAREERTARYSRVIKQWNNLFSGVPCSERERRTRAKYIVMAIKKYESEKCTSTTRDLKNHV